jgi:hypothetical protein
LNLKGQGFEAPSWRIFESGRIRVQPTPAAAELSDDPGRDPGKTQVDGRGFSQGRAHASAKRRLGLSPRGAKMKKRSGDDGGSSMPPGAASALSAAAELERRGLNESKLDKRA